ncbi:hypothetical protein HDU76_004683, partial [Blyttiomyces sp. JEL0837]
ALKEASDRGVIVVNCTQCRKGLVTDLYATGKSLLSVGVVPGSDMTTECALTKLSYVLGKQLTADESRAWIRNDLRGELTVISKQTRFTYSHKTEGLVQSVLTLLGKGSISSPLSSMIDSSMIDLQGLDLSRGGGVSLERVLVPMLLCHASRIGDIEGLGVVAQEYGTFISIGDYDLRTPLHIAASENQKAAVELLLLHGANVHLRDRYGHSPLFDAVRCKHVEIAMLLRSAGAHFAEEEESDLAALIASAASEGNLEMLKLLWDCCVDMNTQWLDGRTALHLAVSARQIEVLRYLMKNSLEVTNFDESMTTLRSGIEIKLDIKDQFGRTPLDDANMLNWTDGIACLKEWKERLMNNLRPR